MHDLEVRSVSQKDRISSLSVQLEQSQKLADMYREQIIQLEDEISRIREEGDIGKELFKVGQMCSNWAVYSTCQLLSKVVNYTVYLTKIVLNVFFSEIYSFFRNLLICTYCR